MSQRDGAAMGAEGQTGRADCRPNLHRDVPYASFAESKARRWLESENCGVDRGFETPVDRQIGAVDPSSRVRAEKQRRGRDVGRRACTADPRDVVIDTRIAKDLAKFLEDRGRHRAGAHRVELALRGS